MILRTEQIWINGNDEIKKLCHLSKNLYNEANYIIRQGLFASGGWIRYNELCKMLKSSENYKALPTQTAQQTLKLVDKNWKSFFNSMKEWKIHPDKFKDKPQIPKYKKKDGLFVLVFTNQQAKIKDGWLKLPKKILNVRTRIKKLRQVIIIPKGVGYVLQIIYEKTIKTIQRNKDRIVGIDFGSSNIVTMCNNIGVKPIIIKDDGKGVKSINQFYNKKNAVLQSVYDLQGIKDGKRMCQLRVKRDKKVHDYVHKLSRFIVDWCVTNDVGTIVFGRNKDWKQGINLGKRNNQSFTQIPFFEIIKKTLYKANDEGIDVIDHEESHTSKCSFIDNEPIKHHSQYVGKRITRSLFKSAKGTIIHADVNAGYNIIKKAIPKAFSDECKWIGGCELHPVKVSIL